MDEDLPAGALFSLAYYDHRQQHLERAVQYLLLKSQEMPFNSVTF